MELIPANPPVSSDPSRSVAYVSSELRVKPSPCLLIEKHQAMELTGSEYWTYFLKQRIGSKEAAVELTNSTKPITAGQALQLGMVDDLMRYSPSSSFEEEVGEVQDHRLWRSCFGAQGRLATKPSIHIQFVPFRKNKISSNC